MQVARLLERRARAHRCAASSARRCAPCSSSGSSPRTRSSRSTCALAPYGGNLEGVRAASLAYFGKEPRRLSSAEAALLVALPQSPEARRPDRYPEAARAPATACSPACRGRLISRDGGRAAPWPSRAGRAPRVPDARAASRPSRGDGAAQSRTVHRLTLDAGCRPASRRWSREHADALGRTPVRRRSSSSTTAPARSSPMSARPASSTTAASAPST